MSIKETLTVSQVKDLFNDYVKPTYIGNTEYNRIELTSEQANFKANNLIRVSQMALSGIAESYSEQKVSELYKTAYADLYDVIECLEIAQQLTPTIEMELLTKLQANFKE